MEASESRKELNGLERDVLANLQSRPGAALLKVDGLFFDTIYAASGQDILLTFAMHDGNHDGLVERYV